MSKNTKIWLALVAWILVLLAIFWIPQAGVIVLIGIAGCSVWKKVRHKTVGSFKIRR